MAVRFIDDKSCMVFLPKDVDGLALTEPENQRSTRIVAREKTPYFSKAKRRSSEDSEEYLDDPLLSNTRMQNIFSQKKPFSNSTEVNRERPQGGIDSKSIYDLGLRQTKEPAALKTQIIGLSTARKLQRQTEEGHSSRGLHHSMSESKRFTRGLGEEDHSVTYRTQIKPSQGSHFRAGGDQEKSKSIANFNSVINESKSLRPVCEEISLHRPESITAHVRAIKDPNPENPDQKFMQLYMDEGFKKKFGTKLAVTPTKVFGNVDSVDVKRGSS